MEDQDLPIMRPEPQVALPIGSRVRAINPNNLAVFGRYGRVIGTTSVPCMDIRRKPTGITLVLRVKWDKGNTASPARCPQDVVPANDPKAYISPEEIQRVRRNFLELRARIDAKERPD